MDKEAQEAENALSVIQEALHRCREITFTTLKKVLTAGMDRLRGVAQRNESLLEWEVQVCCSDGKCTLQCPLQCLRADFHRSFIWRCLAKDTQQAPSPCPRMLFCVELVCHVGGTFLPAINSSDPLAKVDLAYSTSEACSLELSFKTCLAGGQIVSEKPIRSDLVHFL